MTDNGDYAFPSATGCRTCGTSLLVLVDGKEMSEDEILRLRRAPRKIERKIVHEVWCNSADHRLALGVASNEDTDG